MQHRSHLIAAAALLGLGLTATPAHALVPVYEKGDANLKLGFLLQPQLILSQHGTTEDGIGIDPFIRRARIMMAGKYNDSVNFFVETDNPNFGKNGDWSGDTFIQDGFVEFNLGKPLRIDAGMLLIHFSHQSFQSATSLLGMDYHGGALKYSSGKVWRDAGVMFRGQLANDKVDYHLSITNGVENVQDFYQAEVDDGAGNITLVDTPYDEAINPSDLPRIVARVNVNVFDSEDGPGAGGYFYDGIYLGENDNGKLISTKKILSIGAAVDYQGKAVRNGEDLAAWMGIAGDVFWDLPMGDKKHSLNGQIDFYNYNLGEKNAANGMGLTGVVGYRIPGVPPLVFVDWWKYAEGDGSADWMSIGGGVNWWYFGHTANLKAQIGATEVGGGDFSVAAGLQSQLAF
ncbi:MAG: porin [Pseudomonadota bacterium]